MTGPRRGEVVWYPAMFADYDRPFLVISTTEHPFHEDEAIGLSITTSDLDAAIPITADDWVLGDLPKQSDVNPWNPIVLKGRNIESVAGALSTAVVDEAVAELATVCGLE